jgi:hypothetical protein
MQKFNFNNPGGLLNLNPNDTGSLGINISPINEQKKLEDEQRKKEEQRLKLQNLADTFNMIGANQSGDTQRMAFHSNRLAQRKAEQEARQLKAQEELEARTLKQQQEVEFQKQYNLLSPEQKILVDRRRVGIDLPQGSERKIIKGADGFNYYTDGTRVLPRVVTSPEASKRTTIKGADGYNYFVDTGERVLPGVEQQKQQSDRKYEKSADGFYRYVDDGTKVFGGIEIPPPPPFEITTKDVLTSQKDERKTFEATNKGVKNFQQLLDAAKAADGAASYALMIKFIKQLDDSVVREGEVATFGGFQGALTNLKNQISKTTGEGFTPRVKANMINLAAQTANRLVNDYGIYKAGKEESYGAIGFDPSMVFAGLDFNLGDLDLTKEYTPKDFEFIELD